MPEIDEEYDAEPFRILQTIYLPPTKEESFRQRLIEERHQDIPKYTIDHADFLRAQRFVNKNFIRRKSDVDTSDNHVVIDDVCTFRKFDVDRDRCDSNFIIDNYYTLNGNTILRQPPNYCHVFKNNSLQYIFV